MTGQTKNGSKTPWKIKKEERPYPEEAWFPRPSGGPDGGLVGERLVAAPPVGPPLTGRPAVRLWVQMGPQEGCRHCPLYRWGEKLSHPRGTVVEPLLLCIERSRMTIATGQCLKMMTVVI